MIKRLGASMAVVGLLLALVPATISAARPPAPEFNGPGCLDITDGAGTLTGTTVDFTITLAAPSCRSVTYTLTAQDDFADTTGVGSQSLSGNGTTTLVFSFTATDGDGTVCVVGTTSRGPRDIDRAPDAGCLELVDNSGTSGGQGFH